jgi:hypothetical protein
MKKEFIKSAIITFTLVLISIVTFLIGCGNRAIGKEFTLVSYNPDGWRDNLTIRDIEGHIYSDTFGNGWYPYGDEMEQIGYCGIDGEIIPIYSYKGDDKHLAIFLKNGNRRPSGTLMRDDYTYPELTAETIDSIRYSASDRGNEDIIEQDPIRNKEVIYRFLTVINDYEVGASTDTTGIIDEEKTIIADRIGEIELYSNETPYICAVIDVLRYNNQIYYFNSIQNVWYLWPDQGTLDMIIAATPE